MIDSWLVKCGVSTGRPSVNEDHVGKSFAQSEEMVQQETADMPITTVTAVI
jgi:hypothetical protein